MPSKVETGWSITSIVLPARYALRAPLGRAIQDALLSMGRSSVSDLEGAEQTLSRAPDKEGPPRHLIRVFCPVYSAPAELLINILMQNRFMSRLGSTLTRMLSAATPERMTFSLLSPRTALVNTGFDFRSVLMFAGGESMSRGILLPWVHY